MVPRDMGSCSKVRLFERLSLCSSAKEPREAGRDLNWLLERSKQLIYQIYQLLNIYYIYFHLNFEKEI